MNNGNTSTIQVLSGINILAGIWLIIAPFVLNYAVNGGSTTNSVILGVAIIVFAALQMMGDNVHTSWPSWVNTILGVWMIVAPFVLGYSSSMAARNNDVVVGIVVAVLSIWSALSTSHTVSPQH